MGLLEFFTGESPEATTQQQSLWTGWQEDMGEQLGGMLGQPPPAAPEYGGQMSPNMTSLAALENWAKELWTMGKEGATGEGGQAAAGTARGTMQDAMTRGPQDIDDYYQQSVFNPMMEQFQEQTRPAINRQYAPSGFWSSQRQSADQRAGEDLLDALTRGRSEMAYQGMESQQNRALQAAGMAGQMDLQQMLGGMQGFSEGSMNRIGAEQGAMDRSYNDFLRRDPYNRQTDQMQLMLQALGLRGVENITTVDPGSPGFLQSMAPGLGQGLGFALGGPMGAAMGGSLMGGLTANQPGFQFQGTPAPFQGR